MLSYWPLLGSEGSSMSGHEEIPHHRGQANCGFVMEENSCPSSKDETNDPGSEFSQSPGKDPPPSPPPQRSFLINPKGLLISLCLASLFQGIIVNGFVNVVISTLEKRFRLSSRETGVIASSYDIGSMFCVIPLSYLGGRLGSSKPKYISLGLVIMGLGSFIFSLPHFISGRYLGDKLVGHSQVNESILASSHHQICHAKEPLPDSRPCGDLVDLMNLKYLLIFGQMLHGIGASPLVTLGNTLIDESVGPKLAPLYIGIFSTFFVIGPAAGFVSGGQLLNLYTDFPEALPSEIAQVPEALWVGSWWLGFLVMGSASILCAALVSRFPSILPGAPENKDVSKTSSEFSTLKELPKALKALVVNPTYMFLSIGGGIDGFWLSSITAFLPKYVESQFFLSSASAASIVGIIAVPCGGLGTFMGGWLTKRLRLKRGGVIKLYLICQIISIPFGLGFMLSCQTPEFAGISVPYPDHILPAKSSRGPEAPCNQNCSCSPSDYDPICGANGVLYFSPCYGGCKSQYENGTGFEDCGCIGGMGALKNTETCNAGSHCSYLTPFMVIIGFNIFLTFMSSMTTIFATLRAVEPVHKSLALGLSTIILRVIGSIPGPMIFGTVLDKGCVLWKPGVCGEDGANCLIYENVTMSISIMTFFFVFKVLGILSYGVALLFSARSKILDEEDEPEKDPSD